MAQKASQFSIPKVAVNALAAALMTAPGFMLPANAAVLGGINIDGYCKNRFGSRAYATIVQWSAWGWRCQIGKDQPSISLDHACQLQYPRRSARAETTNSRDPYSWRCIN